MTLCVAPRPAILERFSRRRLRRLWPPRTIKGISMRLLGKVSIITGAGQGIGQATAIKFAKEGAKVAVCDMTLDKVKETVERINAYGGEAMGYRVDVTDKE